MGTLLRGKRTGLTCVCHEGSSGGGAENIIDRIQHHSMNRPSKWRTVTYTHNRQWIDARSPSTEDAYPQPALGQTPTKLNPTSHPRPSKSWSPYTALACPAARRNGTSHSSTQTAGQALVTQRAWISPRLFAS